MNKQRLETPLSASATTGRLRNWLALGALSLIWGTSFILIKKGLTVYSPVQVACLRLTISMIAFAPILAYHSRRIDWSKWRLLVIVGLTGSAIPAFLFATAQTQISSSVTGILNSLAPLFTLLWGVLFFGTPLVKQKVLGVLLGLAGATTLILLGRNAGLQGNLWYGGFVLLAAACYAASVNVVSVYLRDMSALLISAGAFFLVGIPATIFLFRTDFVFALTHHSDGWLALGYIAVLAVCSTVVASLIFFQLVKWTNPLFSASVAYLIPIVALLWGLADGEPVGLLHLGGMGLILSGVYLSRS